jgi:hypothetical protein
VVTPALVLWVCGLQPLVPSGFIQGWLKTQITLELRGLAFMPFAHLSCTPAAESS